MALGYCEECRSLRTITPLGLKLGSRECEWAPIHHDADVHAGCGALVVDDACARCGPVPSADVASKPCPGGRRPIRNHREVLPELKPRR